MRIPTIIPIIVIIGLVPNVRSTQTPAKVKPMIGINILQVVSPAVPSNKTTVERSGGVGLSSLFVLGDGLIYVYTVTEKVRIAKRAAKE